MANLNEFLQDYVNKSYDELLFHARYSLSELVEPLTSIFGTTEDAAQVSLIIISACVGIDGKITGLENKFIGDLTGNPGDYSDMVANLSGEKARELTDGLVDSLSGDLKSYLTIFCLCFLAVDETISREEVAFIQRLIG